MNVHPTQRQWFSSKANLYTVDYTRASGGDTCTRLFVDEENAFDFAYKMIEDRDVESLDIYFVPALHRTATHTMFRQKAELCTLQPRQ